MRLIENEKRYMERINPILLELVSPNILKY